MTGLLLMALALQASSEASSAVVLVGRRTGATPTEAQATAEQVSSLLAEANVPLSMSAASVTSELARRGLKDASGCQGRRACLAELGRQLGVTHVVAVSVTQIGSDRSVGLELVLVADETVVEKDALIVAAKSPVTKEVMGGFSSRVAKRLGAPAEVTPPVPVAAKPVGPAPDAPTKEPETKVVTIVPERVSNVPEVVEVKSKTRTTGIILAGVGVAAGVAAITLMAVAFGTRGNANQTEIVNGRVVSKLTASQAQALNDTSNAELAIAGGCALAGIGLGTGAILTW